MATYGALEPGQYHLVQENSNGSIELVFVLMTTATAVLVEYEDAEKTRLWFRKTDSLHELLETFSEETASLYEQMNQERMSANDPMAWGMNGEELSDELWDEEEGDVDFPQKN